MISFKGAAGRVNSFKVVRASLTVFGDFVTTIFSITGSFTVTEAYLIVGEVMTVVCCF